MSYARFGWDRSDVYVFGTCYGDKDDHVNVIECCGCLFTPRGPLPAGREEEILSGLSEPVKRELRGAEDWHLEPFPAYETKQGILDHLREHQAAGHHVPESVFTEISDDDWIS